MATIQDVARHAGVGVGTVSRVLSGKGYVKVETREKVMTSVQFLDYTPNQMARNLFFQKSGIVAVIVPELAHPFFAQFVNAAEAALCESGYQTMICNTYYEKNYEHKYLEMLKQKRVDGIIFAAHTALDVSEYENVGRPIVTLDRDLGEHIPCVMADHRIGGRMAAEELLRAGCRNVHLFGGIAQDDEVATPSNMRYVVFQEMMREHNVECHFHFVKGHFSKINHYQKIAREVVEEYPEMDGAFATDIIIQAILQAALHHGKRVPEDLKLVAYDGTYGLGLITPDMTCVVQPISKLASEAVRLIIDLIDEKPMTEKKIELPVSLHRGDSTRI